MSVSGDPPRHRLLEAAVEVFGEKGFAAASVRDICRQAGVNIAAVNYYFGDKERLYVEALKFAHTCMTDEVPMPADLMDRPPTEQLRGFIETMVARMVRETNANATQLVLREIANPTAACAEMVQATIRPMADVLMAILARLLPGASERERYLFGFSVVGQCLFYKQNRSVARLLMGTEAFDALGVAQIADHVFRLTMHGLEARSGAAVPA
jgi:AcrR family transcriptional regulator